MLHEILLSLSGYPSPLFQQAHAEQDEANSSNGVIFPLLSPPERTLLGSLAHLSELHIQLKEHAEKICSSHPSTISRTVGSAIALQLKQFQQKIIDVEMSILRKDAAYVGGYGIVPLSTIVGEFAPWTRRLEWLWDVARFVLPSPAPQANGKGSVCTGATVMDFLRNESHTGYVDIEAMAISLMETSEKAWMRQLSTWLLYGKLPTFGHEDFFVQRVGDSPSNPAAVNFGIQEDLVPSFITAADARSILFIGTSLNQIRSRTTNSSPSEISVISDPSTGLLIAHLEHLKCITYPISSGAFSSAISSIRLSISQNALSHLLPLPTIRNVLAVLQQFFLLGKGNFAVSLISKVDEWMTSRHRQADLPIPVRKLGRVDDFSVKDGEATAILDQTWSELVALQNDEELEDDILELARDIVRLVVERPQKADTNHSTFPLFTSFLLPSPTQLTLSLPHSSPLHIFLAAADMSAYASINAYLFSIRRADMHLASLWKITTLRRCHPCPVGPPRSCTKIGAHKLAEQRQRTSARTTKIRPYWATASKVLFVVSELGSYFQSEVIRNSWEHFREWLDSLQSGPSVVRPGSASSAETSPAKHFKTSQVPFRASKMSTEAPPQTDPATLSLAHQSVLTSLTSALLLTDQHYIKILRDLLKAVDHFVALFRRLQAVQTNLDLQEDAGIVDALADYAQDEKEALAEMSRSRVLLEELLIKLVESIREIEERGRDDAEELDRRLAQIAVESGYVPVRGRTVDRLLVKLEYLAGEHVEIGSRSEDEYYDA